MTTTSAVEDRKTGPYICPVCSNDCADSVCLEAPDKQLPRPGDYVMCRCRRFLHVDDDKSLREFTEADWDQAYKDGPREYLAMRRMQKKYPPLPVKGPPNGDQDEGASKAGENT